MGYERFIFWFWESPTTGWHACKLKKHFHCLIICNYFILQTICSTIHFSKPLLCVMLICGDWSDWSISFPFHHACNAWYSRQCCFVYSRYRETAILPLQKLHLVAKNEVAFSFRRIYPHSADHSLFSTWCYPQEYLELRAVLHTAWKVIFKNP